jgi:hypothetical protein
MDHSANYAMQAAYFKGLLKILMQTSVMMGMLQ